MQIQILHTTFDDLFLTLLRPASGSSECGLKKGMVLDSDNYFSKFMGSELAWKIDFLSSRGSSRIFKGSHQMPSISRISEDENPNFSIWLFCTTTSEEQSSNQNINRAISYDLHNFCTYFFNAWLTVMLQPKFWCVVVVLGLHAYMPNIQAKNCASQWRTCYKFGAYGIHLMHQRPMLVRNR